MTDITISNAVLQKRIDKLQEELVTNNKRNADIKSEIEHLTYIMSNAKALAHETVVIRAKRSNDSRTNTKQVILDILKNSGREMAWEEILAEFVKIRPDIKPESMRVILSNEVSKKDSRIKKIKDRNNYRYIYSE